MDNLTPAGLRGRVIFGKGNDMRLIVDDLPRTPKECLFGWKHIEYSKWRCKFGRECELSAECRQCSHLVTFATDNNVGTKLSTNSASLGTDCINRQAAIDIIEDFPHGDVWNVESMEEMVDRIKQLPSIQPERKECEEREQGKCPWYAG